MKYKELESMAEEYLATFPDQTPVEIYINGYLAGVKRQKKEVCVADCKAVADMFNETCTEFRTVRALSDKRRAKVRERISEMRTVGDPMEVCKAVFEKMNASGFLRGDNQRGWKATFDWVFENGNNWVKVYEGLYDDTREPGGKNVNEYWDR
jgi:hypothetical protein